MPLTSNHEETPSGVSQPGTSSSSLSRPSRGQGKREGSQGAPGVVSRGASSPPAGSRSSERDGSVSAKYLGMTIDTEGGKDFPSLARVEKFLTVAESFCAMDSPPAQLWQVIFGHLASLEWLVPRGRLRIRSLQWHLKTHWSPESDPPSLPVVLPQEVRRDLSWWMVRVRFGTPAPDLHLYSNASSSGWGAHLLDQHVSGVWSDQEKLLHINLLEMKALFLGLQAFREEVIGHHVTAMCDNSTVVAYVNKQGGTVSRALCLLTSRLLRWTESFDVHLIARYLPSGNNVLADALSRRGQVVRTELSLHPRVARLLFRMWGNPSIDLFCDVPQCETAPVLLASPGSPGHLPGCVSLSLGRPGPVRVPFLSSGRSGDRPCPRVVACRNDSGLTSLAREGVVRKLASSADPTSCHPALVG